MRRILILGAALLGAAALPLASAAARTRPAVCDFGDGKRVPCKFEAFNKDGSFEISNQVYSYMFTKAGKDRMDVDYYNGARFVPQGIFRRDRRDRSCWSSRQADIRLCAW
jgi:hypothetical protein